MEDRQIIVLKFEDSKIPEFKEVRGKEWVYYGDDNLYPEYLTKLFNKSAKHNAIINGKVTYIVGEGLYTKVDDAEAEKMMFKANSAGESLNDIMKKCALDVEIFGGFYLNIIPNKLGGIADIYHLDFERVRSNEDGSMFFYKNDWKLGNRDKAMEFKAFNPKDMTSSSIFSYKEYRPGLRTYCLPNYIGAMNYIEADMEVSKHTLTNAKAGFSATKLINFYNGEPAPEMQRDIQKRMERKFTGADGSKIIIAFNNDPAKAPTVQDLGQSDLTKEDFQQVDALITQNLMAGHQITTPALFGISEPGKLGQRNELKMAYEIFQNTYINHKQRSLEKVFNYLAKYKGVKTELYIRPCDPVGIEITDAMILQTAPKSWILEKIGVDTEKYKDATVSGTPVAPEKMEDEAPKVNNVLTNLTGRQHQQISRIVRQYAQGKLSLSQASIMLKNGFGFTDDDVTAYLGLNEQKFNKEYTEEEVAHLLNEMGEQREMFHVIHSRENKFTSDADMVAFEEAFFKKEQFAITEKVTDLEANILKLIQKNPNITTADIAQATGVEKAYAEEVISRLEQKGFITSSEVTGIGGTLVTRKLTEPLPSLVGKISKKLPEIVIRYSYEVKPGVGAPIIPGTRPFCREMLRKDRLFSRPQIEALSVVLGYSLWDRKGGFWNKGKGKGISADCRHMWKTNILVKK
jgi:predicted transcriptional regulator